MCRYIFHCHLTSGKPVIYPGYFPFQIQAGTHFAAPKETWLAKIRPGKFPSNFKFKHHRAKFWNALPLRVFYLTFQHLPVSAHYNQPTVSFIPLRPPCSSSRMISWKILTLGRSQFLRLSTCRPLLILLTIPHFSTDFNTPLVYPAMSSLGFAHTWLIVHPSLKLTRHPLPALPQTQVCLRALSLAPFSLFSSYHQSQTS